MNIWYNIRLLAKSIKAQNLFAAAKEISSIKLFKNNFNFSKIQELYLNYLYMYDAILKDIITENISKHVIDNEIYEDSYMLWRKENRYKKQKSQDKNKGVHLVAGNKIKFKEG